MSTIKSPIPVLPLRDIVVFPNMIVRLFVGREKSVLALEEVMKNHQKKILAMVRPFIKDFERSWTKIGEYSLELKHYPGYFH